MNRRTFLRTAAFFTAPLMLNGTRVFAGNEVSHPWLQSLAKSTNACNKVLVIVQLNGGNDGLNMVIPLDKYTELTNARAPILIPQSAALPLNGTTTTGLHPAMTGLQDLYNNGKMVIVQGVSYPNPNFSHFQAQDIWFSSPASAATPLNTGWLGRGLDATYPNFPTGYPNAATPHPLAIQIGGSLPLSLQGPAINMGYNVPNASTLSNIANATPVAAPVSDYGTELTFLRMMKDQSNAYTACINAAFTAQATQSSQYPASGNALADQLKVVARLIGGGLTTQVYIVNQGGYDTHVGQVNSTNTTAGSHADLLSKLSVAISAFMNDLTLMGKAGMVTGMTFSEFGRRVVSNASAGTDHGTAAPVLFFGAALHGGILGTSPNLPTTATASTQVPTQYDFRQLYATVLQNWMCTSAAQSQAILNTTSTNNTPLPIFSASPLPADKIDISAAWEGNLARVDFLVQGNEGYTHFVVERSADGTDFTAAGTVPAVAGATHPYRFVEPRPGTPNVFYRIRGITPQGTVKYSATVQLHNSAKAQALSIYPNPVTHHTIHIDFVQEVQELVEIEIFDLRGSRIYYNSMLPQQPRRLVFQVPDMMDSYTPYIIRVRWSTEEVKEQISFV